MRKKAEKKERRLAAIRDMEHFKVGLGFTVHMVMENEGAAQDYNRHDAHGEMTKAKNPDRSTLRSAGGNGMAASASKRNARRAHRVNRDPPDPPLLPMGNFA